MKPILLLLALLVAGSALSEVGPNAGVAGTVSGSAPETSNWKTQTTGITGGSLYAVSVVNGNVCWLAGTAGRVIRTVDGGQTWQLVSFPSSGSVYALEGVSDSIAFASTTVLDLGTFIRRTTDGGSSWQVVFSQPEGSFIFGIRMFNQAKGIAVGDPVGGRWVILKTTNGGETWSRIPTEPPQTGGVGGGTRFGFFDTNWVWFFDSTKVHYYSTNGGQSWSISYLPWPCPYATLIWWNNLYRTPPPAGRLGLTALRTPNPRLVCRWEDPIGWFGVGSPNCLMCAFSPQAGLVGALGTREFWLLWDSVYYTPDAGSTWTGAPPNGLNKQLTSIDMLTVGSEIIAWATGAGDTVYHYRRILTDVDDNPEPIAERFSLSQNYPNPFNPSTNIKYQIPSPNHVTLKVFDILGREVTTLVNGVKQVGKHEVTWNASEQPSGVYFYRLQYGEFLATKKLLVIR